MKLSKKEIKKLARSYHFQILNYNGDDTLQLLNKSLHQCRIKPIKYLEQQIKKIILEKKYSNF